MNFRLNAGFHESLDSRDTAPPPLPPWLKGFLVTSKTKERMKDAGEEVAALLNGPLCKVAFDAAGGSYTSVEPLLVPGARAPSSSPSDRTTTTWTSARSRRASSRPPTGPA